MFSRLFIRSLIAKYVIVHNQVTVQGTKMTFDDPSDFQNHEDLLSRMNNENIDTIKLEGSSIHDLPDFIGIQRVKTFECDLSCNISQSYFYQNQIIKTVLLGANIQTIEESAFAYSSLEYIEFSETTSVKSYAFAYCTRLNISNVYQLENSCFRNTNLKSITITSEDHCIPDNAFRECYNLESVTINIYRFYINQNAFKDCFKLKEIIIQEGCRLTEVYEFSFENCALESIDFSSITYIGYAAFRNTKFKKVVLNSATLKDHVFAHCKFLREVIIQGDLRAGIMSTKSGSVRDAREFFISCQSLEIVDLGQQKSVIEGMFKNCFNLKEIKSSNPDLKIGLESFFSCWSLTKITTNILEIGEGAFMFCKSLETIDITNVAKIESRAFYGCEKLKNILPHVQGEDYAFAFCSSLVDCNVQIHAGIGLLMNCTSLESVTLHGVQYIPDKMFFGCTKLKTVVWPDILKGIGNYAFMDTILEIPNFDFPNLEEIGQYSLRGLKIEKIKFTNDYIYYRKECNLRYYSICPAVAQTDKSPFKDITSIKEIILGINVTEFKAFDFLQSYDIKITIENSHLHINDGVLLNGTEILYYIPGSSTRKTYTIPSTITKIHPYAFTTSKLEEVVINSYINIMGKAFCGCKSLKSITFNFDQQKNSLDTSIFENCISLTTVNLCPSFKQLGDYSFRGCTSLETITIPDGTQTLGRYCFAECSSLKNINFPSNRLLLNSYCFYKCSSLTHLDLSKNLQFSSNVFESSSLKSIKISVSNLNEGIFNMCSKLQKVELTDIEGHNRIRSYCFNSTNISEINLPPSIEEIDDYSFAFTKIKKFFIPKTLTEIHPQAFYGIDDIELELDCDHPKFILGAHELIDKETNTLLMTYGKLLSTYIVPSRVRSIARNAINSFPKYNETSRKVIDFGLTTLVIRTKLNNDPYENLVYNAPYLHNLCYGGNVKINGFDNIPRIFVSDSYVRRIWNQVPLKVPIRGECDSSVPFENYAKYDYTYPKNPKYIQPPEQILPQESKKCALIDDPYEIPKVEPEISPEENSPDPTKQENTISSETNNLTQITHLNNNDETEPDQGKDTLLTFILLAIAVVELLMVAGLIVFLMYKNKEDSSEQSFVEMSEHVIANHSTEVSYINPLFSMNTTIEDDPFASDFEDHANNDEGHFNDCICDDE